ncbi:TPA: hypothetical protein N0F65_012345 [Lagenidium giganteum]|uniref:Lipase-like C-terminal domain-containing protein n=1 Tax=Lagenidium giganteum TaxID=4803 RepID=A0AAV2YIV2_9STRA|nr:TPA: hypothetical protein N0F65_012345 [Lagenidium giganteum]
MQLAQALAVAATLFASCVQPAAAVNNYPIVLVHGFSGWGLDELAGVRYWGGLHGDYQQRLRDEGFDVRTAVVGPFSSNWDRAVELFAYIKGGCVNYGPNHAKVYGHAATGRCFDGIYPEWGNVINGKVNKIHLVGHSMGGQTIRMLTHLLARGSKGAPVEEDPSSHTLFAGGKDWVHSVTTISTPNQGTLLANGASEYGDLAENAAAAIIGMAGVIGEGSTALFDAKLDQWGIASRQDGESLTAYVKRIFSSSVFNDGFYDLCMFSLSTFGAVSDLKWVETLSNVFYYSFSTQDTYRLLNVELPRPQSMILPFQPTATFLGSTYALKRGFSSEWQANDGIVNTISMKYDGKAPVVECGALSQTGRWHHLATFTTLDHGAIVGFKPLHDVYDVYSTHAKFLQDLPAQGSERRLASSDMIVHETSKDIVESLKALEEQFGAAKCADEEIAAPSYANTTTAA